ncbi:hypothetical protein [Microcoleus vaginatus]|uniref:hypothetical protein n=1 Tax=Microcoleus vaginatus TaxID=119532 RepID=UPI001F608191|nr:hypothetical protein D0A37_12605 [Microcoleus vaginatus HSN003]
MRSGALEEPNPYSPQENSLFVEQASWLFAIELQDVRNTKLYHNRAAFNRAALRANLPNNKLHPLLARSHRPALAPEISPITICDRLHKATETLKN